MTVDGPFLWYAAARWLGYLAVFLLVGAGVFRWGVLPRAVAARGGDPAPLERGTVRLARLAGVVLAVVLLVRLYLQARSLIEPEESLDPGLLRLVVASDWGKGWVTQAAAAMAAMLGWRSLGANPDAPAGRALAVAGGLALVVTAPLTGHAVGLPAAGRIGYPLTALHLAGASLWLGTLGVLLLVALRRGPAPVPVRALIEAFSPLALVGASVAVAAGSVVAWRYLGGLDALVATGYGRTLAAKVAALGAVALTGAYNWRVVLPRLRAERPAPIGRTALIESALGAVLLAITAILVALPAPDEHP